MDTPPRSTRFTPLRVLILGGTGEASEIASRLANRADLVAISSLAGRVNQPRTPEGPVRIGSFGGVDGLISYLHSENIRIVIDATHPFAARISANAEAACRQLGLPLIPFARAPWVKRDGDRWYSVPDTLCAAAHVARTGGRVFLTIGRQQIDAFAACRNAWFLIRSIDPPDTPLHLNRELILDRGPFHLEHELRLLRDHAIEYIVSKNSGGHATYSKIEAARTLGIPVVMIDRPHKHTAPTLQTIEGVLDAVRRLELQLRHSKETCAS